MSKATSKVVDAVKNVIIIAHKEDVSLLKRCFEDQGFTCFVVRSNYTDEEQTYSVLSRLLINHGRAFEMILSLGEGCIICEADFVPVVEFGQQSWPFPCTIEDAFWGYLYSNRPKIVGERFDKSYVGFSNSTVCMYLTVKAAGVAIKFVEKFFLENDPRKYTSFDNVMPVYMAENGIKQLIAYPCYGEHGGMTNKAHFANQSSRYTPVHQAETLIGKLSFMPIYAEGNRFKFLRTRIKSRFRGIGRALTGRMIKTKNASRKEIVRIYLYSIKTILR